MSQDVKVCVLFGFGINCDRETAAVFEMVGGSPERLHVNRLVQGERELSEFDILAVPGGFSFGDHLGSGRLLGNRLRFALREQLQRFVTDGKPIIGICNGFQALVKTGLLPGPPERYNRTRFSAASKLNTQQHRPIRRSLGNLGIRSSKPLYLDKRNTTN